MQHEHAPHNERSTIAPSQADPMDPAGVEVVEGQLPSPPKDQSLTKAERNGSFAALFLMLSLSIHSMLEETRKCRPPRRPKMVPKQTNSKRGRARKPSREGDSDTQLRRTASGVKYGEP
eukprot:GHVN01102944.1.p1 GENE.GHVN01102944.1~~GHVN01102944.1.p1  ORF type:complete len:119 (+),score=13.17 GHVN01102944.1:607-963(+)